MTRPRLLVTGASGFLGRHVVRAAVDHYDVVALVGRRILPSDLEARCTQVVAGDINDETLLADVIANVDLVCHLAAHVPERHDDVSEAERCLRANALATLHLAQLCLATGISRFVYASAGTTYVPAGRPARETDPVYPAERATYYLSSKLLGELYVEHLRRVHGLPSVSLRISSIYGPGMPARSLIAQLLANARSGAPLEVRHGGTPESDLVYVSDVAGSAVAALREGEPGIYNVGAGRTWSLAQVAETVRAVIGSTSTITVVPADHTVPASFAAIAVGKAHGAWGYSPIALDEGIRRMSSDVSA